MQNYHEPPSELSAEVRDYSRALITLREEVEAIDWYNQRLNATNDKHLKKILKHNLEEEIEHACMALEWLRRHMEGWDENLEQYLFTEKDITKIEDD